MSMTDPLADMLTRIRNGIKAQFETVDIPSSKTKAAIAEVLTREGFIRGYKILPDTKQNILQVQLKFLDDRTSAIENIQRISKPSMRVYVKKDEIKPVRRYSGIAIVSTTQGMLTDREARVRGLGGEVVCEVW